MKYVLSLMILFSYSMVFAQSGYSGTSGVRSTTSYYGNSGRGGGDQTNNQDNDFIYNDNRKTDHNTTNHNTTNVIEAREGEGNPAWEACASEVRDKSGKKMAKCINNYNRSMGKYTDFDFETSIVVSCKICSGDPEWHPRCSSSCTDSGKPTKEELANYSEGSSCEHSDKACNEAEKGRVQAKIDKRQGHYCPECEKTAQIKIAAERDVRIARENRKATKAKYKQKSGFWDAFGKLGIAAAGVLAPLLVEKERTKQVTSCHNSFSSNGADVIEQNRLAWQEQLYAEERNFLPLTPWEMQSSGQNLSHLCNGISGNRFAGGFGQGGFGQGGFGLPGFNPYSQGGFGQQGIPGFSSYGQQGIGNPFGSLLGGIGGIIPNLNFGLNANAGFNAGATAWTGQTNPYVGTNPYSPFPNGSVGVNQTFNQGVPGGFQQQPGSGSLPFQF